MKTLLAILAVLALGACGGNSNDSPTTAEVLECPFQGNEYVNPTWCTGTAAPDEPCCPSTDTCVNQGGQWFCQTAPNSTTPAFHGVSK
jgi:hypothetical protein